jgi:chemotaxis protein methyltransferase CheR
LSDTIRGMVDYQILNLSAAWPLMPAMDIVMIRNVLIYFSVETKKTILAKVRKVLKPDGYFFLGAAETTFNIDDSFERTTYERATCYRIRKT